MPNELHASIWDAHLLTPKRTKDYGVSADVLAKVLVRVMVKAPQDVPRADIAKGTMLARKTQINPAIVSKAVAALIDMGMLEEDSLRPDEQRAGRPVKPLRLGGEKWGLAGVTVIHDNHRPVALTGLITGLRADLDRDVLVENTVELSSGSFFDLAGHIHKFVTDLQRRLDKIEGRSRPNARGLLGIGVQVAAPVHNGYILGGTQIGIPSGADYDLATPLQVLSGVPVVVDNDVNLLAVRELYRSEYKERDLALVAVLEDGVGAALILDGHVYRGGGGLAAEPGHHAVLPLGPPSSLNRNDPARLASGEVCHCGKQNHVDCFAVPVRLERALGQPFEVVESENSRDENGELTRAGWVFQRGGDALGQGLATIINTVNPSRLVVMLRDELAAAQPDGKSAASEYIAAMERAVALYGMDQGVNKARAGAKTLTRVSLSPDQVSRTGALCAAIRVLDNFVLHARGRDECAAQDIDL